MQGIGEKVGFFGFGVVIAMVEDKFGIPWWVTGITLILGYGAWVTWLQTPEYETGVANVTDREASRRKSRSVRISFVLMVRRAAACPFPGRSETPRQPKAAVNARNGQGLSGNPPEGSYQEMLSQYAEPARGKEDREQERGAGTVRHQR
jgi:hypothetical protein